MKTKAQPSKLSNREVGSIKALSRVVQKFHPKEGTNWSSNKITRCVVLGTTGEGRFPRSGPMCFFVWNRGEFITYADGHDRKVKLKLPKIDREFPSELKSYDKADL